MRLLPLTFLLMTVGCANKLTFEVTVTNNLDVPITVGPVKDGPPYEPNWGTVEQWALSRPVDALPPWGMVIPPGKTADSGKLIGGFERGTRGFLRIYRGQHSNTELLAISEGADRATVMLFPGRNHFQVVQEGTKPLVAKRLTPGGP